MSRVYKEWQIMARPSKKNKKEEIPEPLTIGDTKFRPITSKERKIIDKNRKYWINSYEWSIGKPSAI